jgi:hypothetical protein
MRFAFCLFAASLLCVAPAQADPPDAGFVGAITYKNGVEPPRFACDSLDLVKILYSAGKSNIFGMHPKYRELAATRGIYNEPQCSVGIYREVKVLEPPVLLGPIVNPAGDVKLYFWAVHVDNSPRGGEADYWVLYLDTIGSRPWLQVGIEV